MTRLVQSGQYPRLVLKTDSGDEHYDAGISCAVLELAPAVLAGLARDVADVHKLVSQRAKHKREPIWEVNIWHAYQLTFHGYELCSDIFDTDVSEDAESYNKEEDFLQAGYMPLPPGFDLTPYEPRETEYELLCIRDYRVRPAGLLEFYWKVSPRHTDGSLEISTEPITLETLKEEAACSSPSSRILSAQPDTI